MAAVHFDAQFSPWPVTSRGSPHLRLVQGAQKVAHNLHEVLGGLWLDSPDLYLVDNAQKKNHMELCWDSKLSKESLCCKR